MVHYGLSTLKKKVMRIEGSNLAASNFNFQVSFRASLSSRETQRKFPRKVRAEEKESKNLFAVIRAEEKESPLITHCGIEQ
jgi:hypothetical protein